MISKHLEFTKILFQHGADETIKDPAGKTPRDWAIERGCVEMFDALLLRSAHKDTRLGFHPLTHRDTHRVLFALPFFLIPTTFWIFGKFAVFYAVPIVFVIVFCVQRSIIVKYLLGGDGSELPSTPLMTAIASSTILFAILSWMKMVPSNMLC